MFSSGSNVQQQRSSSNAITGIVTGVASMGAGIGAGAATLVASPVAGAKQGAEKGGIMGGAAGFGGGLLAGLMSLTVGVVGGTAIGLGLMVKGFIDTPGAIYAFAMDDDMHGRETIDLSQVEVTQAAEVSDQAHRSSSMPLPALIESREGLTKLPLSLRAAARLG